MPSVSAVAFTAVLLSVSVVPLCAAKCAFTVQVGLAIDSKLSMKIANVSLLKDCLLFLEHHADSYAAVAYNEVSLDCCTVPAKESYRLIESAGWSTYYIEQQQQADNRSSVFTSSGQFTVPADVTTLKVLAVGGGAGGSSYNGVTGGAGGSGYVSFGVVKVTPSQTIDITVGLGGRSNENGNRTVFGNNLVAAEGGKIRMYEFTGGDGGSGGGAGSYYSGYTGSGGSGGSDGNSSSVGYKGGYGQGWSFTAYFNEFQFNTISAGIGAAGFSVFYETNYYYGGGGGGGVLINGAGISSSNSECYIDGELFGSGPASGYGAGGSGGCYNYNTGQSYLGGSGASGLVYIEY